MEKDAKGGEIFGVKSEIKGIAPRGQFQRSISMDGNAGHYLYKTPYSYARQYSINDSREYNELKDKKDKEDIDSNSQLGLQNSALNTLKANVQDNNLKLKVSFGRQKSSNSVLDGLLIKEKSDTDFKLQMDDFENDSGKSKGYNGYDKRPWKRGNCSFVLSVCSCVLSILTIGLMIVILPKVSETMNEVRQETATSMGFSHNDHPNVNISSAGNFKLNQTYLHSHKRVKWIKDELSEIIPSTFDDCLTVPSGGKYLVFSRFTFNLLPEDDVTVITHFFKLKTSKGQLKDGGYKRKYVSVLENKLRATSNVETNSELRKPSVFIEFFELDAYDQICPNVSNPDLLYESRMDNDVNIVKV